MSDDGFRVGRRVFSADYGDGVIKNYVGINDGGTNLWGVVFANTPKGYTHPCRQADLQLLADEPATPEPQPTDDGRPSHYQHLRDAGHEPWDVMAACFSRDWLIGYNVLTALAYLMRCQLKHETPDDDICKAAAHLAEARAIIEGRKSA